MQSICPQHGCPHAGPARTVEFDFDMGADTAMSVASEMVEDLSLSHEDARAIAAAIKQVIKQLTGQAPMFSVVDRSAHLASLQLHRLQACRTSNTLILFADMQKLLGMLFAKSIFSSLLASHTLHQLCMCGHILELAVLDASATHQIHQSAAQCLKLTVAAAMRGMWRPG